MISITRNDRRFKRASAKADAEIKRHDESLVIVSRANFRPPKFQKYAGNPIGYAKDILGITVWDKIGEVLESIHKPPYRCLVKSGHRIGKSNSAAILINYWFDCFNPGVVITTGA